MLAMVTLIHRVAGNGHGPIKVLARGKLEKKLSVTAHKFSASAKVAIEAAGGSCTTLNLAPVADVPEASESKKKKASVSTEETDKVEEMSAADAPNKQEEASTPAEGTDAAEEPPAEE